MASFGNQNPTPIRPFGQQDSCFQVVETADAYRVMLDVPKDVIAFGLSFLRGISHVRTFFAASFHEQGERELRLIQLQRNTERHQKESRRQGRILASALRRFQRNHDTERYDALSNLASAFRLPVHQAESFIKLHNRRRDDRIEQSRMDIARRCHAQGMSLSSIAKRLRISKSSAGRIMEKIRGTADV